MRHDLDNLTVHSERGVQNVPQAQFILNLSNLIAFENLKLIDIKYFDHYNRVAKEFSKNFQNWKIFYIFEK
jgi:hypothetical protein